MCTLEFTSRAGVRQGNQGCGRPQKSAFPGRHGQCFHISYLSLLARIYSDNANKQFKESFCLAYDKFAWPHAYFALQLESSGMGKSMGL